MGDDDDNGGPEITATTSSSDPSSDCAKAFVDFLTVDLGLAFVTATLALCCLPAFCGSVDHMAVIPVLVRLIRDLAHRRLWCTAGPDDVPDTSVASSSTVDVVVAVSVMVGWSVICKPTQWRHGRLVVRGACCGLCVGTLTVSMDTPLCLRLRVRLCCVCIGVGDRLQSYGCGQGISARGIVLNVVKEATQCCCCAAGLRATGCKRHCWTSS